MFDEDLVLRHLAAMNSIQPVLIMVLFLCPLYTPISLRSDAWADGQLKLLEEAVIKALPADLRQRFVKAVSKLEKAGKH